MVLRFIDNRGDARVRNAAGERGSKIGDGPRSAPLRITTALSLVAAIGLSGCAMQPTPPSVADVVAMSTTGLAAPAIIDKMRASRAVYRLPGSAFASLKSEGVQDAVLDYMLQTYLRSERERQAQYCTMGPPYDVVK